MFETILIKLAQALDKAQIPYMIIGGQAVLVYGEARLTKDIDVTLGLKPLERKKLEGVLKELGLKVLVPNPDDFVQKTLVLPVVENHSGIRIDFVFSYSAYEREAIGRSKKIKIGDASVHYAALEDLLIHKLIAGRPRDLEDVKAILLKNPHYDQKLVRKCLREFAKAAEENYEFRLDNILQQIPSKKS